MDETRYPREGTSGNRVWTVVQPRLAVFSLLRSRVRYVIHGPIGERPQGVVVSDRYAASMRTFLRGGASCAGLSVDVERPEDA